MFESQVEQTSAMQVPASQPPPFVHAGKGSHLPEDALQAIEAPHATVSQGFVAGGQLEKASTTKSHSHRFMPTPERLRVAAFGLPFSGSR